MSTMEIRVENGGYNAYFRDLVVKSGGSEAPAAFELFIASLGNCAAATAAAYCRSRNLPYEGMKVMVDVERNPETKMATTVKMELVMPEGFPEGRKGALIKAAESCFVKKHLYEPPQFITTVAE